MTDDEKKDTGDTLSPYVKLIQMSSAFLQSRVLYAAAKLKLADHLADGPKRARGLLERRVTTRPRSPVNADAGPFRCSLDGRLQAVFFNLIPLHLIGDRLNCNL